MYILGLNYYPAHDTAACLIKDGKLIGFIEEERLNRQKHTSELPFKAIDYLLSEQEISIQNVDCIAIGLRYSFETFINRIFYAFYFSVFDIPRILISHFRSYLRFRRRIRYLRNRYQYKGKIIFVDHHTTHLCSAFLNSPFKKSVVVSIDGSGLQFSSKLAVGENNKLKEFDTIKLPHSIGLLYLKATDYLGFKEYGSEGKVMGLAPYGSPDEYYERFRDVVKLKKNGKYKLNMKYFKYDSRGLIMGGKFELSDYFYKKFGPARNPKEPLTKRHKNIAASLQKVTEEVIFHLLNYSYDKTKSENICLAGGVIMNSVANGKIRKQTPFKNIYIPPAPYDAGNAIGAAFYVWNCLLNKPRSYVATTSYMGPAFSNQEIRSVLDALKLDYQQLNNPAQKCAQLLAKGNIIGWFQGKLEAGARALGNRSILADPRRAEMKDIVNNLVKFREPFRPFAPSILAEKTSEYFEDDYPVPFMEKVYIVKKEKRKKIPAVIHVDGTGRLQTVRKEDNPLYWGVIKEFEKITGVPVIFNTSFNIRGEPIVCTPKDALNCFFGTGMDYLIIGNFIVGKKTTSA